jgi:hypothetical protein
LDEIAKMEALKNMMALEGWPIVEQFIKDRIEENKNRLMNCELKDVIKHRAKAEALNSVLLYIKTTVEEGENALKGGNE